MGCEGGVSCGGVVFLNSLIYLRRTPHLTDNTLMLLIVYELSLVGF